MILKFRNISYVKRQIVWAAAMLLASLGSVAQTDPQMTQYYEVPAFYNPAAIGITDNVNIRLGSRLQWVGIDNAPRAFLGTANMPLKLFGKRFGIGLMAQQESAGLFRNLNIGLQLGYKQRLFKGELMAAVQIGFANEVFKGSDVFIPDNDDYHQDTDEAIPRTDLSGNALDLGLGVFYTHKLFWAGLSCTHINAPTITFSDDEGTSGSGTTHGTSTSRADAAQTGSVTESGKNYEFQLRRTLYFMAGSNIPIKNTLFEVMPSLLVKTEFTTWRAEIDARVRWKKFISAGIGYRYDDAVIATIAAEYKGFYVGYSYDYPTSAISKASSGSHEIIAGYSLKLNLSGKNNNKHKSIRIM